MRQDNLRAIHIGVCRGSVARETRVGKTVSKSKVKVMAKKTSATAVEGAPVERKPRTVKPLSPERQQIKNNLAELAIVERVTPHLANLTGYGIEKLTLAIGERARQLNEVSAN